MIAGFDCHATALAAAGINMPKEQTIDGQDLLPFLTGKTTGRPHERLFWRAGSNHAVRAGDWKLVTVPQQGGTMLFNLKEDIGEKNNVAQTQPEKLKELQAAYVEWEKGTQASKWVRQDARNAEEGGRLKAAELQASAATRRGAARIDEAFKTADKNNDGKLSRDELPVSLFDRVDADKDGFASEEELSVLWKSYKK
jgi:hypothetical protein